MVTINALLATAGSGVDKPATTRNRTRTSYFEDGCLNSSRGVIFPGSHRAGGQKHPDLWSSGHAAAQDPQHINLEHDRLRIAHPGSVATIGNRLEEADQVISNRDRPRQSGFRPLAGRNPADKTQCSQARQGLRRQTFRQPWCQPTPKVTLLVYIIIAKFCPMRKLAQTMGSALAIFSAAQLVALNHANAFCVGICPGVRRPYVRPAYSPQYVYKRLVIASPGTVAPAAPDVSRTACSRNSGSVNAFFRPNYSSSVVANLPLGYPVVINSFVIASGESWGLANLGGALGYIPSINLY